MSTDDTRDEKPDYILDLSSANLPVKNEESASESASSLPRPSLGVHFKCCGVYARIYKTADGQAYAGHCPKCAKVVRVKIGAGGTKSRFFTAE